MELLDVRLEPYIGLMIQDGFSRHEAIERANKSTRIANGADKSMSAGDKFPATLERNCSEILSDQRNLSVVFRYLEILLPKLGRERIEKYLSKNTEGVYDYSFYKYMDKILRIFDRDFIAKVCKFMSQSREVPLDVLSCVPLSEIPDSLDKSLYEFALEDENVALVNVKNTKRINQFIGACVEMENNFDSIFDRKNFSYGEFTLVYVQNILVGAVKMKGEKSFVGLRNVYSDNRFPIILGGAYGTNEQITSLAAEARYCRDGRIYLDELEIMPLRMLGHYRDESKEHINRLKEFRDSLSS